VVDRDLKNIKDSNALKKAASSAQAGADAGALGLQHSANGGATGGQEEEVADARRLVMDWAMEHVVSFPVSASYDCQFAVSRARRRAFPADRRVWGWHVRCGCGCAHTPLPSSTR
jgi:hypothetical protein